MEKIDKSSSQTTLCDLLTFRFGLESNEDCEPVPFGVGEKLAAISVFNKSDSKVLSFWLSWPLEGQHKCSWIGF